MPKILFLCRHADALGTSGGQTDYERPLSETGRQQALQAAEWLATQPQPFIVCSAAARAQSTAILMAQAWPGATPIAHELLYEAGRTALLRFISQLPENQETALLVAHNPSVSDLATYLTGQHQSLATCQILKITLEAYTWQEVSADSGTITDLFVSNVR